MRPDNKRGRKRLKPMDNGHAQQMNLALRSRIRSDSNATPDDDTVEVAREREPSPADYLCASEIRDSVLGISGEGNPS